MNLAHVTIGDGVAVIAAPDPDPSVTPPPADRVTTLPSSAGRGAPLCWVGAEGGGPTVELWYSPLSGVWLRWNNAVLVVPAKQMVPVPTAQVPTDMPMFLRITIVNGATRVTLGLTA